MAASPNPRHPHDEPPDLSGLSVSPDELRRLASLMATLNEHTTQLEGAYRALEHRVAELDTELEQKNEALQQKIDDLDRITTHLNRVLDSVTDGVMTVSIGGRITRANRAAADICGRSTQELTEIDAGDLLSADVAAALREAQRSGGRVEGVETLLHGRDAGGGFEPVPVRLSAVPLTAEANGEREWMLQLADLRELRALEERVRRSDRLRALGELAAGVAHELRNPLTTVRGYVQLLPEEHGDAEFVAEMSRLVLSEIDRLARLTDNLLHLARPVQAVRQELDLWDWVADFASFERERLEREGIALQLAPKSAAVPANIDEERIRQVMLNLVRNAAEAMTGRAGAIRLSIRGEGRPDRRWAVVSVADQGSGIQESELERIFDPFYTTKPQGSGLGLALSHRIVEEHGGHLTATSEPGRGTTMEVWLPA